MHPSSTLFDRRFIAPVALLSVSGMKQFAGDGPYSGPLKAHRCEPFGWISGYREPGLTSGTTVSFNGTAASAQFVDANTPHVTIPSLSTGPAQITLKNPDGQTYTLDDAFVFQWPSLLRGKAHLLLFVDKHSLVSWLTCVPPRFHNDSAIVAQFQGTLNESAAIAFRQSGNLAPPNQSYRVG
jgi:hypothetical protein